MRITNWPVPPKRQPIKYPAVSSPGLPGYRFELSYLSPTGQSPIWPSIAVGVAYFLAAWLGVALRPQLGLCIFCPAAGVAVGGLVLGGSKARVPIAISVAITTVASSIIFGKSPWVAVALGVINPGQALLTTWLIERWFGNDSKLGAAPHVLGFLGASAIGVAVGATGASVAKTLSEPIAFYYAWQICFLACLLGTLTIGPLLIGLGELRRELPPPPELIEGGIAIVVLALLSVLLILLPQEPWESALPVISILPVLLWLAVRCRPVFAAAAASVLGVTIIWSTASQTGHFGDASIPLADRIFAAQTYATLGTLLSLILAALFAERRTREALLKASNEQLRTQKQTIKESESRLTDALMACEVIAFEWDATTRRSRRSANAASILGCAEGALQREGFVRHVHPDDRPRFNACVRALCPNNPAYALTFRFRSPDGRQLWLEETAKGEFNAAGQLLCIKGLTRDISDRKEAERALEELNMQLSLAGRAALVGSFVVDFETDEVQFSEGYAAIHGLPEGTCRTTRSKWRAGVHPEDLQRMNEVRDRTYREQRREYGVEYRITRSTGEVRWIEGRCFVSYGSDGRPARMVGVDIDVTARRQAEEHQYTLVAELDHRVKNALATVSAVASHTQDASLSATDFAAKLTGRIRSMAATHELLSGGQWKGVTVRELVERELSPYMARNNTAVDGPDLMLSPEAGQNVSMVLHELTTNAVKHGALSTKEGRISVRWNRRRNDADAGLCIEWRETGGPLVQIPRRSSYGTEVIRNLIPYELGGTVDLAFASDGLRCRLEIPREWVNTCGPAHHDPGIPIHQNNHRYGRSKLAQSVEGPIAPSTPSNRHSMSASFEGIEVSGAKFQEIKAAILDIRGQIDQ